ncbi:MAG: hypothetical protein INF43_00430 [Alphaproteobacteria bacterium]|nr:hypothetical protein [Alphaproteobacteria bacterium]
MLVSLPAAWLAAGLGVLGQRILPLLPLEWLAWGMANSSLLLGTGPLLVVGGLLVLSLELLRSQRGVVVDSVLMALGGLFWLVGSLLHPSPVWNWLAQPLFVVLFTPALASMVVLTILNGEDSIDASLFIAGGFAVTAALLHGWLWGWPF